MNGLEKRSVTRRILIAGFQHETNTFAPTKASYASFQRGEMYPAMVHGHDVFKLADVNIPIGGFIRDMRRDDIELVPVLWAGASPSAHVTEHAFETIASEIIQAAQCASFDAVYLDLHGAMVTEHFDDGEGELLRRVRRTVGDRTPIVASLDLHANVTRAMFEHADALVAYRTYPHVDMAGTGGRAALLLRAMIDQEITFHTAYRRLPFLIPINAQTTLAEPARGIYELIEELERVSRTLLSFAPGFPVADFPECGGVVWGVGPDLDDLQRTLDNLFDRIVSSEREWKVTFLDPAAAVEEARRIGRCATQPVVIADTQDNPGAGGDSDTMGLIHALLAGGASDAAVGLIVDPAAAEAAHRAGVGAELEIALGARSGVPGDSPLVGRFRVERLSDGICRFDGPMLNGMTANVGPSACLSIGGVEIAVSSTKSQMLDRSLFEMVGIRPERKKIVVVKSSVHFRADFEPIAERIIIAKAPGPAIADPQDLPWTRLAHGMRLSPLGREFSPDIGS